ncbi:maleylacetate reductase and hydroxyquinol 1,2-dioxygenase domain-containing protein [Kibdelosporangium philippinense]|uniref:Maleylacetate reductase and hydroxyquinol 1,2-dioxygenase domain-containing protein n=1 Tax=Kibdelosporangium philippinense TaxID=211113 RepID=A0ABS8ZS40_9PSEU|nr:maleylacetate reductase and hydroxyquinol 1,2-dioxygenase domain-containing protein [Kibdelosporangium philippinense]MCE7010487.1 maleylacetate reductase and hydroxyquinol 1,2-dioxygenase domain-containing protein [Kibdelosporangium philippinense]
MTSFTYSAGPARVVFGSGTIAALPDEVARLDASRALFIGTRRTEPAYAALGPLAVARFENPTMHTPVEVTEKALAVLREHNVDCLVAVGGGSAIGLAKALALRTDLPQIVVPTTYAGSEATPVLGQTADGKKTTIRNPAVLPETIVYDVDLTMGLPANLSVTSGINAMAHAVEALYSPDANPIVDQLALDAIRRLARALPNIVSDPKDRAAREDLLQAAWLAGTCLGSVSMGLHHKLAHMLGGTFGLPHSETHTVLLPHVMAYMAPAAMDRIADALGVGDAPTGVYDLVVDLGGPTSLKELGMTEQQLDTVDEYRQVLDEAWRGDRPQQTGVPDVGKLTQQVVNTMQGDNPRTRELLQDLVRTLHAYVVRNDLTESEWMHAISFLTRTGQITTETRQEFILLSDTLGISSVVDVLSNSRTPDTTPSAVLGPFYTEGPPEREHGYDIAEGLPGMPVWADVQVVDTHGKPVADAIVDVWQSNEDGFYDVQLPDLDGPVLRARFRTDADGRLRYWSIVPVSYPIPDDGPVGEMLRAAARHPHRAPHMHFMIAKPGFHKLITQLFVRGGDYLDSDAVFGVKDDLIVDFPEQHGPTPDGREVSRWSRLDFVFRVTEGQ